jgi:hypothetical protein
MLVSGIEVDALWPGLLAEDSYSAPVHHHHQTTFLGIPTTLTLSLWICNRQWEVLWTTVLVSEVPGENAHTKRGKELSL